MTITVFTPAYNRAHLLQRLYDSLCKQTFMDFEWLIVDDGSTDGTGKLFSIKDHRYAFHDSPFAVRYFYQENGGKHRAVNHGIKEAKGELFLILDSDDSLPPNSLEIINKYYQEIKDDEQFGGVCGCMAHHDGTRIGSGLSIVPVQSNSIELRNKFHVQGDLCEVFKTKILRNFPFPEIDGERFCSELLWLNRIAVKYSLRCFNEIVYYRDYISGGLTDNIIKIRMNSPIGTLMTYSELNHYPIGLYQKMRAAVNYYRFLYCANGKKETFPQISKKWLFLRPLGWLAHQYDQYRIKQVTK